MITSLPGERSHENWRWTSNATANPLHAPYLSTPQGDENTFES